MSYLLDVPLEVAEGIIDQLHRDIRSLRNYALTCRGWLPRARYHLMKSIRIRSRDDLFSIYDYLRLHPDIARSVRRLSVGSAETDYSSFFIEAAVPVFLLRRLPNLETYQIYGRGQDGLHKPAYIYIHRTTLTAARYSVFLEELCLYDLVFPTDAEVVRLLMALSCLRCLKCSNVSIKNSRSLTVDSNDPPLLQGNYSVLSEFTVSSEIHRRSICSP